MDQFPERHCAARNVATGNGFDGEELKPFVHVQGKQPFFGFASEGRHISLNSGYAVDDVPWPKKGVRRHVVVRWFSVAALRTLPLCKDWAGQVESSRRASHEPCSIRRHFYSEWKSSSQINVA